MNCPMLLVKDLHWFHSLRNTFTSWLVQNGVLIYVISKLFGHSDIRINEIYAHLLREELISAVGVLLLNNSILDT